ncbi:MAG TPA: type II secretion system protein GspK [Xanthobacteraceae bacterium]|jgi:general secretion pathway protein K
MALVSVLWGVALLSIIAASFLSAGNTSYRLARSGLDVAQDDAIAEGVVNRAVLGLVDITPERRWRADGAAQSIDFAGARARISIQDELGRIDINQADGGPLASLFVSIGLDAQQASKLVDKILDWRSSGELKRLNGAKARDYRTAGGSYRPRNGPFQSLDELKLVIGMNPRLFNRIVPALTVYSGRPFIDPKVAPPEALRALPGMDSGKIASILEAREERAVGPAGPAELATAQVGRAFTVHAEMERSDRATVYEAVIRLTGNAAEPYLMLNWKRVGAPSRDDAASAHLTPP